MKKVLSILVSLIIFAMVFTGCGVGSQGDGNTRNYTTKGKETKLVADESATGELSISYCEGNWWADGSPFHKALGIFKELYPNVTVNFEFTDLGAIHYLEIPDVMEEYYKKLQTEVMAGNGPDVFQLVSGYMDIDKIMRSGALADMYDYFENDKHFNADDYNQTILKSGQYKGGQYTVPRVYWIPFFMTTKEIASTIGYDEKKKLDYYETWDLLLKIDSEHRNEFSGKEIIGNMAMPDYFPHISGIDFLNMEEMKSNFETEEFKKAVDKQKEVLKVYPYVREYKSGGNNGVNELKRKEMAMWSFNYDGINPILQNARRLGIDDVVIVPFRDINKKIQASTLYDVAVSGSSKNKENAYRFIKILINEKISSRYDENLGAVEHYIPISNIATKKLLDQSMQDEVMLHEDGANYEYSKTEGASQEFVDSYLEMINDIGGVYTSSPVMQKIQEAFQPYFDDEMSYEKCLETAKNTLDIYLSE